MKLATLTMTLLIAGGTALTAGAEITMRDVLQMGLVRGNDIAPLKAGVSALTTNHADRIYAPAGQPAWIDGAGGVWRINTVTNWVVTLPQGFGYFDGTIGTFFPVPASSYTVHTANGGTGSLWWEISDGDWRFCIGQNTSPNASFHVLYRDDYGVWEKICNGVYEYQVQAPVICDEYSVGADGYGWPVFSRQVSLVTNRIDNVALLSAVSNIVQSAINAHIQALHP